MPFALNIIYRNIQIHLIMKKMTVIKYVGIVVTATIHEESINIWIANLRNDFQRITLTSETEDLAKMEVKDGHQSFPFEPKHPSRLRVEGLVHQKGGDKQIHAVPSLGSAYLFLRVKKDEELTFTLTGGFGWENSVDIKIQQGVFEAIGMPPGNGRVWQSPVFEF